MRWFAAILACVALLGCSATDVVRSGTPGWIEMTFQDPDGDPVRYRCEPDETQEETVARAKKAHAWHMKRREKAVDAFVAGVLGDDAPIDVVTRLQKDGEEVGEVLFETYRCALVDTE